MPEEDTTEQDPLSDMPEGVEAPFSRPSQAGLKGLARLWESLVHMGLGESALRVGTAIISIALFLIVVWVMSSFYVRSKTTQPRDAALAAALPTATPTVAPPQYTIQAASLYAGGIPRLAMLHTIIPEKPRVDVFQYTVVQGDTIFGIAEKFNLKPETVLWGNLYVLSDDPHRLQPGQVLNILPINGVYHKWSAGEGLNGVSKFYGVKPEDIVNYPGNHLDAKSIGDFANPNIKPGTMLIVPGGKRQFVTWSAPLIPRKNPAVARYLGPGACGTIMDGAVGTGTFVWPTSLHYLSGFDYSPETNHPAIDIAGQIGNPIYAVDSGVVVYAGWNDWGYGNMVVIDHGNGWQSLYAHQSVINVGCGVSVEQGQIIGNVGSTGNSSGPHLHFELMYNGAKVNPHDYLP